MYEIGYDKCGCAQYYGHGAFLLAARWQDLSEIKLFFVTAAADAAAAYRLNAK